MAIPDKKPDPKEMAGRPYLGGGYAGIASRVLAFSIDVFALIIALIITFVFVWGVVSIFNLDQLFQNLLGTHGFGLLRMVGSGMVGTLVACVYWIFGWTFIGGTVGKIIMGLRVVGPGGCAPGVLAFPAAGDRLLHLRVHPRPGLPLGDREQAAPRLGRQTGRLVGRLCLARPPR